MTDKELGSLREGGTPRRVDGGSDGLPGGPVTVQGRNQFGRLCAGLRYHQSTDHQNTPTPRGSGSVGY